MLRTRSTEQLTQVGRVWAPLKMVKKSQVHRFREEIIVTVQESSHKSHFTHAIVRWPVCRTHLVEHLLAKAFFNVRVLGQHVHRESQQRCCLSTGCQILDHIAKEIKHTVSRPATRRLINSSLIIFGSWVCRTRCDSNVRSSLSIVSPISACFRRLSLFASASSMRGSIKLSMTFLSGSILSFQNSASGHCSTKAKRAVASDWPCPKAREKMLEEWLVKVGRFLYSA